MNPIQKLDRSSSRRPAFTRVDLLALLSVLALLAVVALPALGRVTGKTIIAQCAANLQQYDMALQIYGNENQDLLPVGSSGYWAVDASAAYIAFITNTGVKWTSLYCPGTSVRFSEADNWSLFTFDSPSFGVLGYASTVSGTAGGVNTVGTYAFATNINIRLTAQRVAYFASFFPVHPASRALVADATFASDPGVPPSAGPFLNAAMLTYNWVNIAGGYPKKNISPHLNGTIPYGGNVGMLDGHVEWRNFTNMLPRSGGSGNPMFFW